MEQRKFKWPRKKRLLLATLALPLVLTFPVTLMGLVSGGGANGMGGLLFGFYFSVFITCIPSIALGFVAIAITHPTRLMHFGEIGMVSGALPMLVIGVASGGGSVPFAVVGLLFGFMFGIAFYFLAGFHKSVEVTA